MVHDEDNHPNHLCQVHKRIGVNEEYKTLVKGGKFVCKGCGRVTVDPKSVCSPEPL